MDTQITVRLTKELARALAKRAKALGVPKSQLAREAVMKYLAETEPLTAEQVWQSSQPFIGSLQGDHEAAMSDPLYRQIYEMKFRE